MSGENNRLNGMGVRRAQDVDSFRANRATTMKTLRAFLHGLEDLLMALFKVLSVTMAIAVVLLVEAWGISKVWVIVTGH